MTVYIVKYYCNHENYTTLVRASGKMDAKRKVRKMTEYKALIEDVYRLKILEDKK